MTRLRTFVLVFLLFPSSLLDATMAQPAPPTPNPSSVRTPGTNETEAILLSETFNGTLHGLRQRGWAVETIAASGGFTLLAGPGNETLAATGTADAPYAVGLDARLVTPILDLRRVPGAPLPDVAEPADDPRPALRDETSEPLDPARENLSDADGPIRVTPDTDSPTRSEAAASDDALLDEAAELRLWPPDENLTRDRVQSDRLPHVPSLEDAPRTEAGVAGGPMPEAAARVRLTLRHAWDFATGDGGFAEIRVREVDGAWSAWRPLPAVVPEEERASAGGILPPSTAATATGTLPSGEDAFTGASEDFVRSVFPLDVFAGRVVQVAFRVRSASTLAPQSPGWSLDDVQVRALLGAPDLAVEAFEGFDDASAVAVGVPFVPRALVRNWGALPSANATLRLSAWDAQGRLVAGFPALAPVPALAPGALAVVPYPHAFSATRQAEYRLEAALVAPPPSDVPRTPVETPSARADAESANDRLVTRLVFADVDAASLTLLQEASSVVTAPGVEKSFRVRLQNLGNVARPGRLELWATPVDLATQIAIAPARRVAQQDLTPPEAFSPIARGLAGPQQDVEETLSWAPTERGAWRVEARWAASVSDALRTYVDASPPPALEEPFAARGDEARAFDASSAQRLEGWSFEAWDLVDGTPRLLAPEAPSPTRMLVARAHDGLAQDEVALLAGAGGSAENAVVPVRVSLSDAPGWTSLEAQEGGATAGIVRAPVNASYARLLFASEPARCADLATPTGGALSEPFCEDPAGRVALVNLTSLLASGIQGANITLHHGDASLALDDASFHVGGQEVGLLYVVVDAQIDPATRISWAPLTLHLGDGEEAVLLPEGTLRPYDDGGMRCCVLGPYSTGSLLAALAPLSGYAPVRLDATRALGRWSAARSLDDLVQDATPGATHALAFEHLGRFAWTNGSGVRGIVEIESPTTPPPETRAAGFVSTPLARLAFEAPTQGWENVILPLDLGRLPAGARLRLSLESTREDGVLPDCPYLDLDAPCAALALWRVDEVRLMERAAPGASWRVVARDDLEDEGAAARWHAGVSVQTRGWSVEAAEAPVPHRFHLTQDARTVDAEANTTAALRWGEPSSPRTATREPTWSLARTPFVDLRGLAAPRLRLETRYDFGPEQGGRFAAGGALVALAERVDGSRSRILLVPREGGAEGSAYRGDVDAPAFDALSRALAVDIPRTAAATAFTGRSGVPLGQDAPASWVTVEVDLASLAQDPTVRRVALELHAASAAPLKGGGWSVDDLLVSEPGPAHDLALTGLPTLRAGTAAGRNATVPLAVNLTNLGLFPSRAVRVELAVLDAADRPVHPVAAPGETWRPANVTLPAGTLAPGETRLLPFPKPWIPQAYGDHKLVARVLSEGDERAANDLAVRVVPVRDASAVALRADGPLVRPPGGDAVPDTPVSFRVAVQNRGTLPLDAQRPATLVADVLSSDGRSVLSTPLRVDVPRRLGRPILPGEEIALDLPDAWTPRRSGVHRLVLRLDAPGYEGNGATLRETFVVEERLPALTAERFLALGTGWSNATRGDVESLWSFAGGGPSEGTLALAEPLALRTASQARVDLTHRFSFEEGFDGGRLEARVDGGEWGPVPPANLDEGALHAPTRLALPGESDAPALTGTSPGLVTTTFDLADAPHLRERVSLLGGNATATLLQLAACETWLGPARRPGETVLHAAGAAPPSEAPANAALHERRDVLVQEFLVPANATGDLRVSFEEWRALGLGALDAPRSDVFVYVEGPLDGPAPMTRHAPDAPLAPTEDRVRDWTSLDVAFPGWLDLLRGQRARLVIEHRQIAAPAPAGFMVDGQPAMGFSSDLLSPHGGVAVTPPIPRAATPSGEAPLPLVGDLMTGSASRWLPRGAVLGEGNFPALAALGEGEGFHNASSPARVWEGNASSGWTARANASSFPDARLVLPLDLSLAQREITLLLEDQRDLMGLIDTASNASGMASVALVEVSADGGATWIPLAARAANASGAAFSLDGGPLGSRHAPGGTDPEGNSPFGPDAISLLTAPIGVTTFDLTPLAGKPILVGLHAAFSTTPGAKDDVWRIRSLRVDADVFRGGDVDLRLRAVTDANGASASWDVAAMAVQVVRHSTGLGIRLLGPGDGPVTEGFRTLDVDVLNRGVAEAPPRVLRIRIEEPAERGGRVHEATRPVPALAPGQSVRIPVRGADLNWYLGANESASRVSLRVDPLPGDTLPGDDLFNGSVGGANVRTRSLLVPERLEILPQTVDLANATRGPVTFRAVVRNDGEDAAGLAPSRLRIYKGETLVRTLEPARPAAARVEPVAVVNLTWSWRPASNAEKGEYRVVAEVLTATSREPVVSTLEGRLHLGGAFLSDLAYAERFGAAPGQASTRPGWLCEGPDACAREDEAQRRSAPASLALGLPSTRIPAEPRALLTSPPFPVVSYSQATLRLYARHDLAPAARTSVDAAALREDGTQGPWRSVLALHNRSAGFDEGAFQVYETNLTDLLAPGVVAVVLRFDVPRAAEGSPLPIWIDDVSVTPLDATMEPPSPAVLADAVEKRLLLRVRNPGALSDSYVFTFADALGRRALLPAGWKVRLVDAVSGAELASSSNANLTRPLEVPAGGEREVLVLVTTPPTGAGAPLQGPMPIPLTMRSLLLPDLERHATLDLHARGSPRPDLAVVDLAVRGADEPVGRTRTVEVALANRGLSPAQAPLVVLVHPPLGVLEAPERLAVERPQLSPGATRIVTLPWTPRHPGVHRLVAIWDPDGTVLESDVLNNRRERETDVAPAPFPDLRVEVETAPDATLRAPHAYRLVVENRGSATARQVEATLRAGVSSLLDPSPHPLGDLEPGARRVLAGEWTPLVPGSVLVGATAFARAGVPEGVETLGDNAAQATVHVRQEALRIDAKPAELPRPGLLTASFRLLNTGNANETYALEADAPAGWSAAVEADGRPATSLTLAPGATANVTLLLAPPARALAGPVPVTLRAISASEGVRHEAAGQVVVPTRGGLRVVVLDEPISPSDPALYVALVNDGNAPARARFTASAFPEGWRLLGATATAPPYATTRARLALDLGEAIAPTAGRVNLGWLVGNESGAASGPFRLAASHRVVLEGEAQGAPGGIGNVAVHLVNLGNVGEQVVLRLDLPEGARSDLDGRVIDLAPGDRRTVNGTLTLPVSLTEDDARLRLRAQNVPATPARVPIALHIPDLRLADVEAPPALVREGEPVRLRGSVLNNGTLPREGVVVELYLDGRPVLSRALGDLPPGAVADFDVSWRAQPGQHSLALVAAASLGAPDARPENDAQTWTLLVEATPLLLPAAARAESPSPPLLLALAMLALVALALRRRRG